MPKSIDRYFLNLAILRTAEIATEIERKDRIFLDLAAKTDQVRAKLATRIAPQYRYLIELYTDYLFDQRLLTNQLLYRHGFRDGLRAGRILRSWRGFKVWRLIKLMGKYLRKLIGISHLGKNLSRVGKE